VELDSAKHPNTFTTPCFPGIGGVELKKHGVGVVELFFLNWSAPKQALT